jgi:Tol biopolymer transport system component
MNRKKAINLLSVFALIFGISFLPSTPVYAAQDVTTRVSLDSSGVEANNNSYDPTISSDGKFVAFESWANNLVTGDTNGYGDIFVHDTQTGETTRVSLDSSGGEANNNNFDPSISSDGRYVAFESLANNLVTGDTNGHSDIFVHDTQTGETTRVSVDSSGGEANDDSFDPFISSNGRYVAFLSYAINLVTGDTNGYGDIFVHDTQTGETARVSLDSSGGEANDDSGGPSISSDGRYVAFLSYAKNLVTGDTNGYGDVFVHDTQTGETTRVSLDSSGVETNDENGDPFISSDGRYVAFGSLANNLVIGDTNGYRDIFVHDTQTGETTRVSLDSSGGEANDENGGPSISSDGRYVAFVSYANNLVTGDTNGYRDIFVHDIQTGVTTRVSVDSSGGEANNVSYETHISSDSKYVSFRSSANNLVAVDSNGFIDIFVHQFFSSVAGSGGGGGGGGCFIATAAYGSSLEPHVMTLRQFRDEYLLTNKLGTKLVGTYYKYSPSVANFIAEHDNLRSATRIGLAPFVGFSLLAVNFGMVIALTILFSLLSMIIGGTYLIVRTKESK